MENRGAIEKREGFVIFASPRSGSTSLADMIASQGYSVCYEPFNPVLRGIYYDILKKEGVGTISQLMGEYDCVKHLSGHGGELVDRTLLGYKSIILRRRNILQAALSYCISSRIGVWKARQLVGGEYDSIGEIAIPHVYRAIGRIRHIEKYRADKVVYYEDLYGENWEEQLRGIFDYFGIVMSDKDAIGYFMDIRHRMNSSETYDKIKNIKEIEKLGCEEYGWL